MRVARRGSQHVGVRGGVELVDDDGREHVPYVRLRGVRAPRVVLHVRQVRILVAGDRAQVAAALDTPEIVGANGRHGGGGGAGGVGVIERGVLALHVPGRGVIAVSDEVQLAIARVKGGAVRRI